MTDTRTVAPGRRVAFGQRLSAVRRARHLTQKALAKAVGTATRSILAYEKGDVYPRRHRLFRLANELDCGVGWLEGSVRDPGPPPLPQRYSRCNAEQLAAAAHKAAQRELLVCCREVRPASPLDAAGVCGLWAYHPGPCLVAKNVQKAAS